MFANLNLSIEQDHTPVAFLPQAQMAMAVVGWTRGSVGQFR